MDNTMSPADIAALTRTGDGFGTGNGAWWIIILFLFVFMGGGNFFGNRNGDYGQYATAATQQEILFGQQFGRIDDRLTNIGNGICSLGYDMQGNIAGLGKEIAPRSGGHHPADHAGQLRARPAARRLLLQKPARFGRGQREHRREVCGA